MDFLEKRFIKDYQNVTDPAVRRRYGVLSGTAGICFNLLLFGGKFTAGMLSGSIAITADAFNNLSDAASCIVTIVGFRMAGQKPDAEHPFGHGRIEYLTGLLVSLLIILMGFELLRTSFDKVLHPETLVFTPLLAAILLGSIAVKLCMYNYNNRFGKRLHSVALHGVAMDSFSDCVATSGVFLCSLISVRTGVHLDGYGGMAVSAFILYTGFSSAAATVGPLLGQRTDRRFADRIVKAVTENEQILGVHDLIVHDYGPGRRFVSLHAELSSALSFQQAHELVDAIESELQHRFRLEEVVIHMDPVCLGDPETNELRRKLRQILHAVGPDLRFHDLRLVRGRGHTNVLFDVVVPYGFPRPEKELAAYLKKKVEALPPYEPQEHLMQPPRPYRCMLRIDHQYASSRIEEEEKEL